MISYIFKNKINNAIVAVLAAICAFVKLSDLWRYLQLGQGFMQLISAVVPLLIFMYMVTIRREYKIKKWLFPAAFAFSSLTVVFSIFECFNEYAFSSLGNALATLSMLISNIVLLTAHILCLIGSLYDFKRIRLLTVGIIINCHHLLLTLLTCILSFIQQSSLISNSFLTYLSTISKFTEIRNISLLLLFYISIAVLSLRKKSENIDITPFVEARKAKKEAKKAKKLQEKNEELISPIVPEGSWRCMGCGEILSDDKTECECGYKK